MQEIRCVRNFQRQIKSGFSQASQDRIETKLDVFCHNAFSKLTWKVARRNLATVAFSPFAPSQPPQAPVLNIARQN